MTRQSRSFLEQECIAHLAAAVELLESRSAFLRLAANNIGNDEGPLPNLRDPQFRRGRARGATPQERADRGARLRTIVDQHKPAFGIHQNNRPDELRHFGPGRGIPLGGSTALVPDVIDERAARKEPNREDKTESVSEEGAPFRPRDSARCGTLFQTAEAGGIQAPSEP